MTYPQCRAPTGMKNPLENPNVAESAGEIRKDFTGKAQIRAISKAIQHWLREIFTTTT